MWYDVPPPNQVKKEGKAKITGYQGRLGVGNKFKVGLDEFYWQYRISN